MAAQEQERRRIAREPHDEVDQPLTAAWLQLDRAGDSNGALAESREARARDAGRGAEIARRLRPEELDELGLRSAETASINRGWPGTTAGQWAEIRRRALRVRLARALVSEMRERRWGRVIQLPSLEGTAPSRSACRSSWPAAASRVNTISPGIITTEAVKDWYGVPRAVVGRPTNRHERWPFSGARARAP